MRVVVALALIGLGVWLSWAGVIGERLLPKWLAQIIFPPSSPGNTGGPNDIPLPG